MKLTLHMPDLNPKESLTWVAQSERQRLVQLRTLVCQRM